ncbi:ScbR family autoregulator-binding transcription factor [Saccharothrix coeruleofusca]|uniref:TetR family transcriptional regulator n=1 Tax=Saccharothrix coeruleofusca TaxID=33919 RepID=A0A918AQQ7_9PSEU|nr:ScbR family autoregulator-binding transcription factor [Saccharothrix coeruleofusca]MBP2334791.1 AcrR family transcriptional regulator [Saccharothrix coeruleofusca]GGP74141.1 TetR family transcriptional regulator [Saccharothrix coeruleofusca]
MTKQVRSEHTRARLVRSAAELFDQHGFAGTNISDITRVAGVTKGALYFHFQAKEELVEAIQEQSCAKLGTAVAALEGESAVQALIDLTHTLEGWLATDPMVRASFRVARECADRGAPFLDFSVSWSAAATSLLTKAARDGQLAEDISVPLVVVTVLALSVGAESLCSSGLPGMDSTTLLADVWRLFLPGLVGETRVAEFVPEGSFRPIPQD